MSPRKIRMTQAGLVAMPAGYNETTVSADDLAHHCELCTAWTELQDAAGRMSADRHDAFTAGWLDACEDGWNAALTAALDNDLPALRAALTRARDAAAAAGLSTVHEDAALAMLPGDAS